jgi:hypothetical protein
VYPKTAGKPRVLQGIISDALVNGTDKQYTQQNRGLFSLVRIKNLTSNVINVGSGETITTLRDALGELGNVSNDFSKHEIVFTDQEEYAILDGSASGFAANQHCPIILRGATTNSASADYQTAVLRQSGYSTPVGQAGATDAGDFRFTDATFSLQDIQLRAGEVQFDNALNTMMIAERCLLDSKTEPLTTFAGTTLTGNTPASQTGANAGVTFTNPVLDAGRPTAILTSNAWRGRESYFYGCKTVGGGLGVGIPVVVNHTSQDGTLDASHAPCTVKMDVINMSENVDRVYQRSASMTMFDQNTTYAEEDVVLVYYNSAWRVYEAAVADPEKDAFIAGSGDLFPKDSNNVIQWTDVAKHTDGWQGETFSEYTSIENVWLSDYTFDGDSIGQPWFWRQEGDITGMVWKNWNITMSSTDANLNTRAPFAPPNHWLLRDVGWASGSVDRFRIDMSDLTGSGSANRGWATIRTNESFAARNILFDQTDFVNGIYVYDEADELGTGSLNQPYGLGVTGFAAFANPSGTPAGFDIELTSGTATPELTTGT